MPDYAIAVHGGAGAIRKNLEREAEYRAVLDAALEAGKSLLEKGGSAVDASVAAVAVMEDSPLYNAGCGAVFNANGFCELDAAVMDGKNRKTGGVAGVTEIKNPVYAALAVLRHSRHVLLGGAGAHDFARLHDVATVENAYFHTEERLRQLHEAQEKGRIQLDFSEDGQAKGTVGAVARDQNGNLAAATSTGGLTNKSAGRIGDTPVTGAGTYAENGICAISCTGTGDEIMRIVMAYDIAAQIRYTGADFTAAAKAALDKLAAIDGEGGLIGITAKGEIYLPFNSKGMFRGSFRAGDAKNFTAIF